MVGGPAEAADMGVFVEMAAGAGDDTFEVEGETNDATRGNDDDAAPMVLGVERPTVGKISCGLA